MRRGCVWPIRRPCCLAGAFSLPRPSASAILGSCVVLPEPVSPQTMTTWCCCIARHDFLAPAETGSDSGKVMSGTGKAGGSKPAISAAGAWPSSGACTNAPQGFPAYACLTLCRTLPRLRQPPHPPMSTVFNFTFVPWFRSVAPYIHMHRGKTFVVGDRGRSDRRGQAAAHRAGPGADPEHGREGRAGARLPARRSTSSSRPRAMRPSTRTACASPTKWRSTARRRPPASCATRSRPPSARACPTRRWPAPRCA